MSERLGWAVRHGYSQAINGFISSAKKLPASELGPLVSLAASEGHVKILEIFAANLLVGLVPSSSSSIHHTTTTLMTSLLNSLYKNAIGMAKVRYIMVPFMDRLEWSIFY